MAGDPFEIFKSQGGRRYLPPFFVRLFQGWRNLLLAALLLLPACLGAAETEAPATVKLAVVGPFSGDFQSLGQSTRNGVILAVEEWNQREGVVGHPIEVIRLDSQCDALTAYNVTEAAISDEGVQFIIGGVCAGASKAVARLTISEGVLQISPATVEEGLTLNADGEVRPLVFRVPFTDAWQGQAAATFALSTLRAETAAVLYAEGSTYGNTLAEAFIEHFRAGNIGEIVMRESYERDQESYFDLLDDVRIANPDILYLPGYYNTMNTLAVQAKTYGINAVLIGSDGWDSPALAMDHLSGAYFTTHYVPTEPSAVIQQWIAHYEASYIVAPDALATLGYDAANLLLTAMEEAGAVTDPYLVAEAMMSQPFEGITGRITFNEQHNPLKAVPIVQIRAGEAVYVQRVTPE
ncbi:MAG: ABC transporter substrate-binding protein [Anaerolineales bacterium]